MIWEKHELVNILSYRRSKLKVDQQCQICKIDLVKGTKCFNIGIIDRRNNTFDRWYTCEDHEHYFNTSVEDSPEYVREYLLENRYIEEV